ncbi:RPAP1-like protein [Geopyxis carbonaria]|nr:RPAP1-like protein [Geopyxis carbonaria]
MEIPGERFNFDLDDLTTSADGDYASAAAGIGMGFIGDIIEKPTTAPVAPTLPTTTSTTGFPTHKKRVPKGPSRFKLRTQQQQQQQQQQPQNESTERQRISDENDQRIAAMSPERIEEERGELLAKLDPALVERLLKRRPPVAEPAPVATPPPRARTPEPPATEFKSPDASRPDPIPKPPPKQINSGDYYDPDDAAPPLYDENLFPPTASYHFPRAPVPSGPPLDPSSPDFLSSLHEKYFPDLPSDPTKLAWMAPVSADEDLAYHPSQSSTTASALRFDFSGTLIPPSTARELPVTLGLHHHADAPNAAGYTIPELSRLARSTVPAQRCMAIQLLGRVLYRLGAQKYRVNGVTEVEEALWRCIADAKILESLEEAAAAKSGGLSVKAYATDALWLWQKGGGKRPAEVVGTAMTR